MKYNGRPSFHSDGMHTLPCMRCKDQLVKKNKKKSIIQKVEIEKYNKRLKKAKKKNGKQKKPKR